MSSPTGHAHRALYGSDEPLPPRLVLHAGALSIERVGGRFGPVRAQGWEVWHGLAFLFRDAGWGTPEPVFDDVQHHANAQGFVLTLQGHIPCQHSDVVDASALEPHTEARIDLRLTLQGLCSGRLLLQAQATPSHTLRTNRCGWVLLHPLTAAGSALEVLHEDGRRSQSTLPEDVPPWPPLTGVRELRHVYAPGCWAQAHWPEGDQEVEDQRNNADASFKTYSRSNMMPRPYLLRQGQTLVREMHLTLLDPPPLAPAPGLAMPLRLRPPTSTPTSTPTSSSAPSDSGGMTLGLAITPAMSRQAAPWLLARLRRWRPAFLHLTLWPDAGEGPVDWLGVRALLEAAGARLRLDLCGTPGELQGEAQGKVHGEPHRWRLLAQQLTQAGIAPTAVAALPCGPETAALLRTLFPAAQVGGGTPHFFAQLNRLEDSGGEDFMAFTLCPTVHDTAHEAVMDGLRSLPSMLQTARRRHPGRAWHLGPSGLGARASPLGPQPRSDGTRPVALARRDPRSHGLFGAAWLLGQITMALHGGVQALTLPALCEDDGLCGPGEEEQPDTPASAMLELCLGWRQHQALTLMDASGSPVPLHGSMPLVGIGGQGPAGRQMLLANLSAQPQTLSWPHGGRWSSLDAGGWLRHRATPGVPAWRALDDGPSERVLPPCSLAWIDLSFTHER